MPRKGENIYKRKDGRWEGRLIGPDGKYQYFYAKTYRDVRAKMKENDRPEKSVPKEQADKPALAADLMESWLNGTAARLKRSTYDSYYHCLQGYVLPHFRLSENQSLSEESVLCFVKSITHNSTISEAYQKKILSIFKTALRDICKNSPEQLYLAGMIVMPKITQQKEIPVFSMKEQRLLEQTIIDADDSRLLGILLCFYTGIRLGELCALKWCDFDFEAGNMSICRTVSRIRSQQPDGPKTQLLVGAPKSRSSLRKIPLPAFLLRQLSERSLTAREESCYMLSGTAHPFDPRIYQRLYKSLLKKTGIRERKFHATRHTFATRALELGVDIKTLSELLGHANVSITLNVYAHSLMEQKVLAIKKLNDLHTVQMAAPPFTVNPAVIKSTVSV
ncbi:site-specific integrase [Oscillospiraceae bacterium MB08-C2-2]|nr:site-specific integrase [Oscillospiraceae bacterium MB08-C2-2]